MPIAARPDREVRVAADSVLWSLRAKHSIVRCVLRIEPARCELLVQQDQVTTVRQVFREEASARARATEMRQALNGVGWKDTG
jgi:hypothetical protein